MPSAIHHPTSPHRMQILTGIAFIDPGVKNTWTSTVILDKDSVLVERTSAPPAQLNVQYTNFMLCHLKYTGLSQNYRRLSHDC